MAALTKSEIETILENKLGDRQFEIISYEKRNASDASIGYLSSVEKSTVYYKIQDVIQNCSLFVKRLPLEPTHHEEAKSMGCFQREADVFNSFLNHIRHEEYYCFPTCLLARNDILVLEDLALKGYKNTQTLESFDLKHCMKTLDSLAKLHGASLAWENAKQMKLNKLIPGLENDLIFAEQEGHVGRKRYMVGVKALRKFTEVYLGQYPVETVSKAFDFLTEMPAKLRQSTKYPNVLSHNDLWSSNIMFCYDDIGEVQNACIIDFQCATYRPPTYDLLLFIHCCTSSTLRKKYWGCLLKYYYDQLKDTLRKAGIDVFSLNTFHEMCKDDLPFALGLAVEFVHFTGIPDHLIKPILENDQKWKEYYQFDRDQIVLQAASESLLYRNKLIELLKEFFEYFE